MRPGNDPKSTLDSLSYTVAILAKRRTEEDQNNDEPNDFYFKFHLKSECYVCRRDGFAFLINPISRKLTKLFRIQCMALDDMRLDGIKDCRESIGVFEGLVEQTKHAL